MSWTRKFWAALAVCVLLPLGAAGCDDGAPRPGTSAPSPVGKVLTGTDGTGRHLRQVAAQSAPEVGVEVTPDPAGGWDVRLSFHRFRCSAPDARPTAVPGRGRVRLLVDGHQVARLRTPRYHLPPRLVPHGTHHVTARLYADDGTVWAVQGRPVQSTADITVSDAQSRAPSPAAATPRTGG
ncbi:hypothetical protein ACWCV9_07895 [Streptomyces sp. NPDC001606]